ncbi:hypothetical protein B0T19DRAFT_415133 [Cercophora scortea]|uniref:Secreted protein n=1 Tax=Cercophora scortea TaxID=314031 RepID=A0AAE0MHC6_9PEZI|nr:hypothetical protein B0T19DRAFT_415133 [Cercophora scortea]
MCDLAFKSGLAANLVSTLLLLRLLSRARPAVCNRQSFCRYRHASIVGALVLPSRGLADGLPFTLTFRLPCRRGRVCSRAAIDGSSTPRNLGTTDEGLPVPWA